MKGRLSDIRLLPTADLAIKKLAALEALSRYGKADVKLLSSISIDPNLWPTSAVIDWLNILQNMADIPNRDERRKEAEQILRSRLNFQGTKMGFSTEGSDSFMVADGFKRRQCRSCHPVPSPFGEVERRYAEARSGGIGPADQGEMGSDPCQCLGCPGHGEIF